MYVFILLPTVTPTVSKIENRSLLFGEEGTDEEEDVCANPPNSCHA